MMARGYRLQTELGTYGTKLGVPQTSLLQKVKLQKELGTYGTKFGAPQTLLLQRLN